MGLQQISKRRGADGGVCVELIQNGETLEQAAKFRYQGVDSAAAGFMEAYDGRGNKGCWGLRGVR